MNRQLHTQEDLHADRKYKDRLFRLVFSDKKDLLDLYNAVNGTDYDNPEELGGQHTGKRALSFHEK